MGEVDNTDGGISRRTVTKAMAWAVPAVAVAATVPNAAASICNPTFSFTAGSCKCPGQGQNVKEYYLGLCVSNASGCPLGENDTIYVWEIRNNSNAPGVLTPAGGFPIAIPVVNGSGCQGSSQRFDWVGGSGSSAGKLRFRYNFNGAAPTDLLTSGDIEAPPNCPEGQCAA